MRSGKMDTLVVQMRATDGDDGMGGTIPGAGPPAPVAEHRAQIIESSTEEFFSAGALGGQASIVFRTRFIDDLLVADFIRHDGVDYTVKEHKEIGRRRGSELRCVARAA